MCLKKSLEERICKSAVWYCAPKNDLFELHNLYLSQIKSTQKKPA